ncbi:hypothetical protein PSP6_280093 [Paraburkholderia tropica]|nr:hypothetical protein PSP6_280093 [Paraburkholderia tropica]
MRLRARPAHLGARLYLGPLKLTLRLDVSALAATGGREAEVEWPEAFGLSARKYSTGRFRHGVQQHEHAAA